MGDHRVAARERHERRVLVGLGEWLERGEGSLQVVVGVPAALQVGKQHPCGDVIGVPAYECVEQRNDLDARFESSHILGGGAREGSQVQGERAIVREGFEPERQQIVGDPAGVPASRELTDGIETVLARDPKREQADRQCIEVLRVLRVRPQLGQGSVLERGQLVLAPGVLDFLVVRQRRV